MRGQVQTIGPLPKASEKFQERFNPRYFLSKPSLRHNWL